MVHLRPATRFMVAGRTTSHHTLGDVGSPNLDRLAASLSERLNADEGRDEALLRSDAMSAVPRPV
jgi:hypothetical protein